MDKIQFHNPTPSSSTPSNFLKSNQAPIILKATTCFAPQTKESYLHSYPKTIQTMELYPPIHASSLYPFFLHPTNLYSAPQNYVRWAQTPESHIYTADLPGVRKEELKVEVEDGRYLVIRTDLGDDEDASVEERRRSFMRKFRLPEMVDVDRISAGYENGVLTVRVPRRLVSRRPRVEDIVVDLAGEERNSVARAA